MVSVGQGTQREIDSLVSGLGSHLLDISTGSLRGPGCARQSASSFYTLGEGDVDAIRAEIPEVQYVAGALRGGTQVVFAENNAATNWQGVQPDWFAINDLEIGQGAGFDAQDYSSAAKHGINGKNGRRHIFGEDRGVRQDLTLGRGPLPTVG